MNLPRAAVRNPVAANLVMWLVVVLGCWSAFTLVREMFPNSQPEQITITIPYPGATPAEVEKAVARIVEREIEDVDDVEKIESTVLEGVSITVITLEEGADRQAVLNEVRGEMDKVLPDLPDDAEEPQITLVRPYFPVIAVTVYGEVPEQKLHEAARQVLDDLIEMPNISQVVVSGMRAREIWIQIQPEKLEEHGLTFEEVGRAVASSNRDIPGGQLKGRSGNVRVRTLGETDRARELESLVVRSNSDGAVVRLRDLGEVRDTFEDRVEKGRFNGKPAVSLTIFKTPEQDALEIADSVKAYCKESKGRFGPSISLGQMTDLSRFIRQRLDLMLRNARLGLVLVILALALFLNLRVAFWVAIGLAIAFLGTFALMSAMGVTINLITLFALIIVLGLIVDDAIVIGENVFTKIRKGIPPSKAAIDGTNEVALPVLAAVTTTIIAFVPLALIKGNVGTFLGVLPIVVIAALLVSLLEAFFILPAHLAHSRRRAGLLTWVAGVSFRPLRAVGTTLATVRDRVVWLKYGLTERWAQAGLEIVLKFLLQWRYVTVASAVTTGFWAAGLVVGGIVPFVLLGDNEAETVSITLEMAAGTPEARTLETVRDLEKLVFAEPEVKSVFAVVGTSFSDRGRITPADPATVGQLNIELLPAEERQARDLRSSKQIVSAFRKKAVGIPGVNKLTVMARTGGPGGPDIEIKLRCEDLETLARALVRVREDLASYAGVEEIEDDLAIGKLEARLRVRDSAEALGIKTSDLALQVRHALFGYEVQDIQSEEEEVTVRVLLPESARDSLADLRRLFIEAPGGRRFPLEEVALLTTSRGYASLARSEGKRAVTIKAAVDEDISNVADITSSLAERLTDLGDEFPGASVLFEGRRKETADSLGSLAVWFPVALFCMYAIIAILFRSYTQPILVMTSIPFALVGAVLGHWLMGSDFTVLSMIGAVALTGIVVNDSIILVDFINKSRREGMRTTAAVVRGARNRLRAILLTSVTTICGLAPLMLETSFQAQFLIPMAISLVFGLAFATIVTPILLPCFYLIYEDIFAATRWIFTGRFDRNVRMRSDEMPA